MFSLPHEDIMPPLMFGGLIIFLLIGFPAAFSLAAVGLFFGFISIELGFFPEAWLFNLPLRIFNILSNDLLLAIPFFTLMGAILERCGLAEDLLEGTGQLFGKIPAASPMPSSSSAPSSAPSPARSPPASSRWA